MKPKKSYSRRSIVGIAPTIIFALAFSPILSGQSPQARTGFPQDWSHRQLVFSHPGSFREAVIPRRFRPVAKVASDPRFRVQQMKRTVDSLSGPSTQGSRDLSVDRLSLPVRSGRATIQRD